MRKGLKMEATGISIGKESWGLLREEPLYSARFIDRAGTEELALVMRVEMLDWLLEVRPPMLFNLVSWRSPRGAWVVILSYQVRPSFGGTKGGSFYLNPRRDGEAEVLRKLVLKESLPVIFLSEDCESHYTVSVPLDSQMVALWRGQVEEIKLALRGQTLTEEVDAEFDLAVRELLEQP
jgi:hypothetical protein